MSNNAGTARWQAPEVFRGRKYSISCDIYSWAMIQYELCSRKVPFYEIENSAVQFTVATRYIQPTLESKWQSELRNLMEQSWSDNPDSRPNIGRVVRDLQDAQSLSLDRELMDCMAERDKLNKDLADFKNQRDRDLETKEKEVLTLNQKYAQALKEKNTVAEQLQALEKDMELVSLQLEEKQSRVTTLEKHLGTTSRQLIEARKKCKEETENAARLEQIKKKSKKDLEELQHKLEKLQVLNDKQDKDVAETGVKETRTQVAMYDFPENPMGGSQKKKTRNQRTSAIQSRDKKTSQNGDTNSSELMVTSDTTQNPQRNPSVAVTIAEAILHNIEPPQRASIYLSVVITLSLLADYWDTAKGSHLLYSSRDVLNQYFVKLGWGWTFSITGIFMLVTSFGRDKLLSWRLLMSLVRLAVGTGVWYCFAQALFPYVEHKSGICQETKHLDKRACRRAGFMWNGFDASGHCFLLIWNCLLMVEESKAFINWETLKQYLAKEEEDLKKGRGKLRLSQSEQKELKRKYDAYIPWVKASFIVVQTFELTN